MVEDIKWIKLDVNIFSNDKIKQIKGMPDGNTLIVIWLQLLCLAGRSNSDGSLMLTDEIPFSEEMLCTAFDCTGRQIHAALATFQQLGMVEVVENIFHVSNWKKYQSVGGMERIREKERRKKAAQRERARQQAVEAADTPALPAAKPEASASQRRFDTFWKAYPKKVGKGAAEKSFMKYKVDDALLETMLKAIEAAKRSEQWQRDGGQYIPNPATWLNQRRWEDELPAHTTPVHRPVMDDDMEDWDIPEDGV